MGKKIIIIGGGITGLCAGSYLQMNGYETEIYEMHTIPGGLCTSWKKGGYNFDGCIHWLVGTNPTSKFYKLWNELLDMKSISFYESDEYFRLNDKRGKQLIIYRNVDKLEKELLSVAESSNDKSLIQAFCKAVRKFSKLELPVDKARETMTIVDGIKMMFKMLPYFRDLNKWVKIAAEEFAAKFDNPLLQKAFELMFVPEMSTIFLIFTIAWMSNKNAGYPIGGSLNFARLLENKYMSLKGKINYNSKVNRIITENNIAKGIILDNGDKHYADIIISASDGHFTIYDMLEGKYTDEKINKIYSEFKPFPSYIQVSLGISGKFENQPSTISFVLDKPIQLDELTSVNDISFRIFNFDKTMSPEGKISIVTILGTRAYEYWNSLKKNDINKYKSEKERIANEVIEILEKKLGNIKQHIEVIDVSTPSTVIRYTNNWKGSLEGWLLTQQTGFKTMRKELPGLKNFYMAGQWVEPGGGLPGCIMSGRGVTQIICKKDRKKFQTINN